MAYLFSGTARVIQTPAVTTHGTACSALLRFKMMNSNTTFRPLMNVGSATLFNMILSFSAGGTDRVAFELSTGGGAAFPGALWTSGFSAASEHVLIATYDGTTMRLYADTDATPKATTAEAGPADAGGSQLLTLGHPGAFDADSTMYEVVWAPGIVWSGAQAAQLGGGSAVGIPLPANYYDLIADPCDMFGGKNGVNSGAGLVAHAGRNLWPLASTWQPLYQRAPVLAQ